MSYTHSCRCDDGRCRDLIQSKWRREDHDWINWQDNTRPPGEEVLQPWEKFSREIPYSIVGGTLTKPP